MSMAERRHRCYYKNDFGDCYDAARLNDPYGECCDADAAEAEIALLRAALRWALDNGAKNALDGTLRDDGCGCCSDHLEIPTQFAPLIAEATKQETIA
jgi:hypothetical protein